MKKIPLRDKKGGAKLFALVDDEDFDELNRHKWSARFEKRSSGRANSQWVIIVYATRSGFTRDTLGVLRGPTTVYMHRQIAQAMRCDRVTHNDNNPLNNQRYNIFITPVKTYQNPQPMPICVASRGTQTT